MSTALRAAVIVASVIALLASAGSLAAAESDRKRSDDDARKREIRKQVREGHLNNCVTDRVEKGFTSPIVTFVNHCDVQINLALCVRAAGGTKNYFQIIMPKNSEARQQLLIDPALKYQYTYNVCDRPYCTAPQSDC